MINVNDTEYGSVEDFAVFLRDEERATYSVEELCALNTRTHLTQHCIRHMLETLGFCLEHRVAAPKVRGYMTSSHDRYFGPGSDASHGGGGF
jgi:hypothetical protein